MEWIIDMTPRGYYSRSINGDKHYRGLMGEIEFEIISSRLCLWSMTLDEYQTYFYFGNPFLDNVIPYQIRKIESQQKGLLEWMKKIFKELGVDKSQNEIIQAIQQIRK